VVRCHRRINVKIVDATMDIRGLENDDIWFIDPVHPIDPVYRRLATGVITVAASFNEEQEQAAAKRRRTDSWEERGQRRGPPLGAHTNRPHEYNYSRYGNNEQDHEDHTVGGRARGYRGRGSGRRPESSRGYFRAARGQFN
jgi:hypothetical protein